MPSFKGTREWIINAFLQDLVRNLYDDGNDKFRGGNWKDALDQYTEALNVADYASSEDISIVDGVKEKLYTNRASCYLNIGHYNQVLEDCDKALQLNHNNYRALYRKARALKELGRHKEAYNVIAKCSLGVPQDDGVMKLTQELAQILGLKIRKAYIRAQVSTVPIMHFPGLNSESSFSTSLSSNGIIPQAMCESFPVSSNSPPPTVQLPHNIPLPTTVLVNGGGLSFSVPQSRLDFIDCDKIGDDLDELLDSLPTVEECKKDILICRLKNSEDRSWKKIRPRPTKNQYVGPYYICKDVAAGEECRYPGHCTFAYCQEEIDIWTLERKGAFNRELLFDPFGSSGKVNLTVAKLLQEHHGIFMFLCEICFDNKPRMINKRNKDNPECCSNPDAKHIFDHNKCLVHILRETTVKYSKIHHLDDTRQLDLCCHEVRFGCIKEDNCFYAHSLIELKVWIMQLQTNISHEAITQESKKYLQSMEASSQGGQIPPGTVKSGSLNLNLKFVCAHCHRNGQFSEPDKNRKYCSAKASHPWTKERRVLLVMSNERKKWTTIRPLPSKKPIPQQFDLCMNIAKGKKCQYTGNCFFAHSHEEKEMWTYMKDINIQDMEQLYEMWLKRQEPEREEAACAPKENGKQIHMPTDYADLMTGYHCWLCGKNSNSEIQWQRHITAEKHKEKVFSCEDDQNCWQHRFPTGQFSICERHLKGTCVDGENCHFAHSKAEMQEWMDRREVLKQKLAKARKDHLIAPNDNDFGKFDFLIKDLN
uniref:Zinc finger CCCH-type containing 7A n=1 Tax=Callorhinchus milii TaxID=7868 RepID=A0A4W3I1W9_CALMI